MKQGIQCAFDFTFDSQF